MMRSWALLGILVCLVSVSGVIKADDASIENHRPVHISRVTTWTIVDLSPPGSMYSTAIGLNDAGQAVGEYRPTGSGVRAFIYDSQTGTQDLSTLTGTWGTSAAAGINNLAEAAGYSSTASSTLVPVGWDSLHQVYGLPVLPTAGFGFAQDINDAGQIAGFTNLQSGGFVAFIYENGTLQVLPSLGMDYPYSNAVRINQAGQVVGTAVYNDGSTGQGVIWEKNGVSGNWELMTIGPSPSGGASAAYDINEQGQVVGGIDSLDGNFHACLWDSGVYSDLGTLPGDVSSIAYGVNNSGKVVGISKDANNVDRATLWQDDQVIDLNELLPQGSGWVLQEARQINDAGQIIGKGVFAGQTHGYLLIPPPPDCNSNGIPDDQDIAECNGDLWCIDCNATGVPDGCEVIDGIDDHDCNDNLIPDECEGSGDGDFDCDVDVDDYGQFFACLGGPESPYPLGIACVFFDMDGDLDVDMQDFAGFQESFGTSPLYCEQPAGPCNGEYLTLSVNTNNPKIDVTILPNGHFQSIPFVIGSQTARFSYSAATTVTLEYVGDLPLIGNSESYEHNPHHLLQPSKWRLRGIRVDNGRLIPGKQVTLNMNQSHTVYFEFVQQ